MKLNLTTVAVFFIFILFSCKKEKSYEPGGNVIPSCTPDYKGDCKLVSATYNTFDPSDPTITYNFTYSGNLISKVTTDFDFNINLIYNSGNLISRVEYEDDASGEIFYYEEIFYNSQKKPDSLRSWVFGNVGYEYNGRYNYKYNSSGLLTEKTYWLYDEPSAALVRQNVYTYKYDNGQATLITDTLVADNPPIAIPYAIVPSATCNPFQLVHPQIELFDFNGDDFNFGYTILFNSQKVPASIGGQPVVYTYNSKNAPTSITINGDLWATYTYNCP
jgi:hypothetical protein